MIDMTIGMVPAASFAARIAGGLTEHNDDVHLLLDQGLGHFREPVDLAIGEALVEAQIAAFEIPSHCQALAEQRREWLIIGGGVDPHQADDRHPRRVLCERGDRGAEPGRQNSKNGPHSMTSSAWARIDCGIVRPIAWAVFELMMSRNFEERLAATLPHPAKKAELADKPSRHLECQGGNDRRLYRGAGRGRDGRCAIVVSTSSLSDQ